MKEINAKYKSHCARCLFTIFKNERVMYDGKKVFHLNCLAALKDKYPRYMTPNNERLYGKVNRVTWAETLKANGYKPLGTVNSTNYKHRANRRVRLIS